MTEVACDALPIVESFWADYLSLTWVDKKYVYKMSETALRSLEWEFVNEPSIRTLWHKR